MGLTESKPEGNRANRDFQPGPGAVKERDWTGDDAGAYERRQASEVARLRGEAFDTSKQCYSNGDHGGAREWSQKGKEYDRQVDEWNAKAADAIFASKNKGRPVTEVDLHGLFVHEAEDKVRERIELCRSKGYKELHIITGKGIHSENHKAKIKPAIIDLVEKANLQCHVDQENTGVVIVQIPVDHAVPPPVGPEPTTPGKPTEEEPAFIKIVKLIFGCLQVCFAPPEEKK